MRQLSREERLNHPVPDEQRVVRAVDGLVPVLPPAGQLPGDPGHRLERGQLGP